MQGALICHLLQAHPVRKESKRDWMSGPQRAGSPSTPRVRWDLLHAGLQDPRVVPLQVAAAHLDGHLVVTELKEEIHKGVTAAGDGGVATHCPVLFCGVFDVVGTIIEFQLDSLMSFCPSVTFVHIVIPT